MFPGPRSAMLVEEFARRIKQAGDLLHLF